MEVKQDIKGCILQQHITLYIDMEFYTMSSILKININVITLVY